MRDTALSQEIQTLEELLQEMLPESKSIRIVIHGCLGFGPHGIGIFSIDIELESNCLPL